MYHYRRWIRDNPRKSVALLVLVSFHRNIGHLQIGIGLIPVAADVFEREAKGLTLTRSEWRQAEIDSIGIGSIGLQNVQRNIFGLCSFSKGVSEGDVDGRVGNGFVPRVGDGSIDVGYAGPHKILRRAHFQIRKFEVGRVGMWRGRASGGTTSEQCNDADHHQD